MSLSGPLYDTLYRSIVKTFTEAGGYGLLDSFGSNNASAAYSLRSLRDGYIGPAIRVRRSGDNAERDFSHGQIDNGVLTNWVNQLSAFDPEVATDLTDQALAAHSLRDLTGLSRPVVRLRRASDSTEQDFTAADLRGSVTGAELVTNGDFATGNFAGWSAGSDWSVVGGVATLNYTGGGSVLTTNNLSGMYGVPGVYKLTFDITCNDYPNFKFSAGNATVTLPFIGITADGTYSLIFDIRNQVSDWGRVTFLTNQIGLTATIDNVSLVPYTPSAAEEWVIEDGGYTYQGRMTTKQSQTAHVTMWYDQSASNEQVFDDPTIQSPGDWTDSGPFIDISEGLISVENAFGGFFATYNGGDIQPGTYRLEVDYYGVTQANRIAVEGLLLPMGSGTKSETITVTSPNTLSVTSNGGLTGQTGYITGIRLIDLGNPATQSTSTAQPKLIKAGVTNTVDNKPAILFNDDESSVRTWLDLSYFPAGGSLDSYYVVKPDDSIYLFPNGTSYYGPVYENAASVFSYNYNNANFKFYVNGRDIATSNRRQYYEAIYPNQHHLAVHQDHRGDGTATNFGIYANAETVYNFNGSAQEILVYDTSQLANRTKIERNINRYYNLWYEENTKLIGDTTSPTAAAAYSLRSLDGDATANVVRLRRASDNEERDFTAADLVGGVEGEELITNGGFDTNTDWYLPGNRWDISSGQAVCDGTNTTTAFMSQNYAFWNPDSPSDGDLFILSFDIVSCSDFTKSGMQLSNIHRFWSHYGIGSPGSYKAIIRWVDGITPYIFSFVSYAGVSTTLDNVSLKPYTATAAEEWMIGSSPWLLSQDNAAYVTTWYDQAASNEQVFEDPAITGSWTETDPNGEVAVTSGLIRFSNVTTSCSTWASGSADIPVGTYRFEVDYENSTATGVNNILVGIHLILNYNVGESYPAGSGTISFVATVETAGKLKITAAGGSLDGSQSFDITAIRVIDIGNSATQSTAAAQPKLITAGVTELENGKPAIRFDGSDDWLDLDTSSFDIGSLSSFGVLALDQTGGSMMGVALGSQFSDKRFYVPYVTGGNFNFGYGADFTLFPSAADTDQHLHTLIAGSVLGGVEGFRDGSSQGTTSLLSGNDASTRGIGGRSDGFHWDGTVQELIVYDSDQSQNREAIEDNINDYYSIYGDDVVYDGFVTVWYDQSKNSNHATQSTFTNQPKIVSSGVLLTENGKPTLSFDGVDDYLTAPSYNVSQPIWSMSVSRFDSSGSLTNRYLYCTQDNQFFVLANNNNALRMHAGVVMTDISGGYSETQQLQTFGFDSTTSAGWANGQSITFNGTDSGTNGISASMDIGRRIAIPTTSLMNGTLQELIFYPSDQSANRRNIETNINNHYNIY